MATEGHRHRFRWGPTDDPSSTAVGSEALLCKPEACLHFGPGLAAGHQAMKASAEGNPRPSGMGRLIGELLRPYRGWLAIILLATAVETAMGLAAPWPLKIVLDNVIGGDQPPGWLGESASWLPGDGFMQIAAFAAIATVIIAAVGALASYLDNYYTESVGQWVANDLRVRVYDHLEHLPLAYYDTHQTGTLLSTITDDIATIQGFASSSTLGIVVDLFTITGMLGLMFWLSWDFALIAVGVAPFLLLFVMRFRKAVKKATREVRRRESDVLGVVQQGLESIRVVNAFGRQELEEEHLQEASRAAVQAALKARRVKSMLPPVVAVTVSLCTAFVLWRGASLVLASAMTAGSLTVFLSYLHKFFKPVQDLAKMTGTMAQAAVGVERVRGILDIDMSIPERPDAREPGRLEGAIEFDRVAFAYDPASPVLRSVTFSVGAGQFVGIVGTTGSGKSTVVSLIPRFYDPTAALDSESEKVVIEALERVMKGRTVITIAHRLSTIRDADKIVVLKDGLVAEQGSHDELVALGGEYAGLHRLQAGAGAADRRATIRRAGV